MEEIYEVFEQSKKSKKEVDHLDRELTECQGELAHSQDDLAQSQEDLEEALGRQTVLDEKSKEQRVYEMALLDKRMKLEEMRLSTA